MRAYGNHLPFQHERARDQFRQTLTERQDRRSVRNVGHQYCELVGREPRQHIARAQQAGEPGAHEA